MKRAILGLLLSCVVAWGDETNPYVRTASWKLDLRSHSDTSPALDTNGNIYFGTFDGTLWAVSAGGEKLWTLPVGREIMSAPSVAADGTIYFGCRDNHAYAVSAEGKKKWSFRTERWVDASPSIAADGTVYFGSWDRNFYALKPDGSLKWKFRAGDIIVSSAAIGADGRIYFGSHDGRFYALNPDGSKAWHYAVGGPIISSPAITRDGVLYFTSVDGFFYAVNADGRLGWRLQTGGVTESSPAISADGTIYVGVNRHLWAITPEGKKVWDRLDGYDMEGAPVALANGHILFITRQSCLVHIKPDREFLWGMWLPGYGNGSPSVGADGNIVLPGGSQFVCFSNGVALASSPWPKFKGNTRNTGNIKDSP
jgi:outer membrane protein assembly factor BamB